MLMLFPETGLLSYIIDELETAAAADDGLSTEEQGLLDRLREVDQFMDKLDLSDAEAWQRVEDAFT
jgi:ribosome assembly protein YihI (activator of Der GTPase)